MYFIRLTLGELDWNAENINVENKKNGEIRKKSEQTKQNRKSKLFSMETFAEKRQLKRLQM